MILLGTAALLAIAFGVYRLTFVPRGPLAPDFSLTDSSGKLFRLDAQRGRTVALFFGYTHCPDVCPTTLAALARAKRRLPAAAGRNVDVVFVTIDPARDTPALIGSYVHQFDPAFIGLTGTPAQLDAVYAHYHIFHQKLPAHGSAAGYPMAHSSTIQFIGPRGGVRAFADWSDSPDQLVAAFRKAAS